MPCNVEFAFRIGERVREKATHMEGKVTALLVNAQGHQLVQFHDGRVNGGVYHWHREEAIERLEN